MIMYYSICILSLMALQVSSTPVPTTCDHLMADVKEHVQTYCQNHGHSFADGDPKSAYCALLTYDVPADEPCPSDLQCLTKYLDGKSNSELTMVNICSCLDAFKVVVAQRNEEVCRTGNFFNIFANNVKKVIDIALDTSVHNTKKANQKIDDIEEVLKRKYGLQSSVLNKLRTITDPVRKQELADKISANLDKLNYGKQNSGVNVNKNVGWNKGNAWKSSTGSWKTTTTKRTTTKKTTTTTTKKTTTATTTTPKPPFPCSDIDLYDECHDFYPFSLSTEDQISCAILGEAIFAYCELEGHTNDCYKKYIDQADEEECACFGIFEALKEEDCNPEVAVCTDTCPDDFHPSKVPPPPFEEDCKAQGHIVVNDCEGDSNPDACYAAYLDGTNYGGYDHVDELMARDSINWDQNSANCGKCTCWGLAYAKKDQNSC